ncbi:hypothetical protein NQX30_07100 [Candidatus Persebacteraceae bacterium Df01]|uniref:Uncharacterized protein n=1 Tax=Candidatus Doriopsillibacter californiensis TaxID=2970740 RepID=A0ABT7QNQ3_9GAMM|nr:hypothetical protein [Candidatus Persebacteraceae bacterium Df01]MDM5148128.1 hypothetical protein [Candidatus Persebacteraceae bacterium Df01]
MWLALSVNPKLEASAQETDGDHIAFWRNDLDGKIKADAYRGEITDRDIAVVILWGATRSISAL